MELYPVDCGQSTFFYSGGTLSAPTGCSPRDYCRMFFDSAVVLEASSLSLSYSKGTYLGRLSTDFFFLQKSCELVARYTELENQQIQLNLNLKLAQENLRKAQEEAKGMAGEVLYS